MSLKTPIRTKPATKQQAKVNTTAHDLDFLSLINDLGGPPLAHTQGHTQGKDSMRVTLTNMASTHNKLWQLDTLTRHHGIAFGMNLSMA